MDMDNNSGGEPWQDFEQFVANIAAGSQYMAGIDKKEIAALQALKNVQIDLLDVTFQDRDVDFRRSISQQTSQAFWVRFDKCQLASTIEKMLDRVAYADR